MIYLQKTLNLINYHATKKTNCLAAELDSDNDEMKNEIDFFNIQ